MPKPHDPDFSDSQRSARDDETRIRGFADTTPAMLWVTGQDGSCTFLSRGWYEFTGQEEKEALGFGWLEAVHPDDKAAAGAAFLQANAGRKGFALEHRVRHVGGEWRWVIDAGQPRFSPGGTFLGFAGSVTDIHARRIAEDALRLSEERYRGLLNSIDQGFCVMQLLFDAQDRPVDYRFIEANAVFERQTGLAGAVGRTALELVPGLEPHWFALYGKVAVTGEPARFTQHSPAMGGRWFDVYASRIGTPAQRQVALLFNDITERKQAEQALIDADRRKDEFLATLAHELRNPLAPIRSAVEMMRLVGAPEPRLVRGRNIIDRQVSHLTRLIDDLLDVSRITRDRLELRTARVAVADILRDAVENSRPEIEERRHVLQAEAPPASLVVEGDTVRLVQVVMNLLTNAAKYSKPGGTIRLGAAAEGGEVAIRVRDTGQGISADHLPHVFDLFFQAERGLERSQGGLGIGLSLVRRLAELHGGSVSVTSAGEDMGSEFTVRLPLATSPVADLATTATVTPSTDAATRPRMRVLVVDDNRDSADTLAEVLRLMDCEAETAYDGLAGVEKAGTMKPDAVVLDLGMPGLNGYEACERIRAQPWGRDAIIAAVSGWGQAADRERTTKAGFDAHLVKPVMPTELVEKLLALRDAR